MVFLRRYIIVHQFLILRIPKTTPAAAAAETSHVARSPQGERGQVAGEALWWWSHCVNACTKSDGLDGLIKYSTGTIRAVM